MRKLILILLVLGLKIDANASRLSRAFEALEIYNYFQAKKLFEKSEKKHPVAASYGLSVIYQRSDNPFHDVDSAYAKIVKSFLNFSELTLKKKEKYAEFGVDSLAIYEQRNLISTDLYKIALEKNSIQAFNQFLNRNPWSDFAKKAEYKRDSLAFHEADEVKTSGQFKSFMEAYPNSIFYEKAKAGYEKQLYLEATKDNTLVSYMTFVEAYPSSPYRDDAEDIIFKMSTETGSVESYELFIETYPTNRNVAEAWRKLYNTYVARDYSKKTIETFKKEYPLFPFMNELDNELKLVEATLLPIKQGDLWGFIQDNGSFKIIPQFKGVEPFTEGLAVARMDDKYGFINKKGNWQILAIYDDALPFKEGHALVEQNELWGLINRNGEYIVPAEFEDLGELNEGLAYFEKDGLYGYFDEKGIVRLQPKYDEAFDFENGKALVAYQDNYGVIDEFGTTFIPFKYEELRALNDSLYISVSDDYYGVINLKNDTIIPFEYDFIGEIHEEMMIVEMDDEFNYMNLSGELLLEEWLETYPEYQQLAVFQNGFARINNAEGYNLLGKDGVFLFKHDKEDLGLYNEFIAVKKGDSWGYVSKSGTQLLGYNYSIARSFGGNFGFAGKSPLIGMIDRKGNYIIEPYFESLSFLNDSLVIGESRGWFGILTIQGDTLLPFNYVSVEPYSENIVEVEKDNSIFYYDLKTNTFIRIKP